MDELSIRKSGPVASIAINRPERKNAFSREMWERLPDLISQLEADAGVRVIVIESVVDGIFSAGADVDDLRRDREDAELGTAGLASIRAAFEAVAASPLPSLAVIDGECHGGGIGLAICADVRLATTRARISIPAARLGVVYPAPALRRLMWNVGSGQTRRLLLTGSPFDAAEAGRIGLVDLVVEPSELSQTRQMVTEAMATSSPASIAWTKQLMAAVESGEDDFAPLARRLEHEAISGSDHAEGVAAFLDKRPPRFDRRKSSDGRDH